MAAGVLGSSVQNALEGWRYCIWVEPARSRSPADNVPDSSTIASANGTRLRLMRKAQKIRRQLGGSGSLQESFPDRPRAMHEKRYQRMKQLALTAEEEWRRRSEYLLAGLI